MNEVSGAEGASSPGFPASDRSAHSKVIEAFTGNPAVESIRHPSPLGSKILQVLSWWELVGTSGKKIVVQNIGI
ncbi:hypothetical protein [Bifidobacterium reuteri]|uniref:hypothetical protein n=1 Tax=Bifidobacterium reuteri TaxID=983706 RepID=UPI00126A2CF3|nr:hypothetical protein [Bifidobacterium reuteri]